MKMKVLKYITTCALVFVIFNVSAQEPAKKDSSKCTTQQKACCKKVETTKDCTAQDRANCSKEDKAECKKTGTCPKGKTENCCAKKVENTSNCTKAEKKACCKKSENTQTDKP